MVNGLERKSRWETLPDDCTVCGGFVSSMVIQPNGDVGPCELMPTVEALKIGTVRGSSLRSLWESRRAERIAMPTQEQLEEPCLNCEHFKRCRAGCRAAALLYSSNPFAADPHCPTVALEHNPILPQG